MSANRLIIFVKAPRRGIVKTRLARTIGAAAAAEAYVRLAEETIGNLRSLQQVELCYTPDDSRQEIEGWLANGWQSQPQGPGDLGQRMSAAFERAFAEGMERVAIIGSDCATVTVEDIQTAWEKLASTDVVLGPASDGGYWLIGLREPHPELFNDIPWSTPDVLTRTLNRVRQALLSVHLLREQRDVDTEGDWREFLAGRPSTGMVGVKPSR